MSGEANVTSIADIRLNDVAEIEAIRIVVETLPEVAKLVEQVGRFGAELQTRTLGEAGSLVH